MTEREGRVIERFAGDAMMVVFNALTEQPDHALRAARAALGVRTEVEAIAAGHPGRPPFRLGINTGPAIAGDVRGGPQRSFAAIGDTTNLAARLQAAASPGQIVLGPETCRRIVGLAHIAPLEPLVLKGKPEPVEAGELLGLTP